MSKKQLLNCLSILGIICCIALGVIYYQANYNPYSTPSFCSINSFVDCDGVAQTSKAVFLGVPLTYWGLLFYMFVLMLLNLDSLMKIKFFSILKVFKNPYSYISVLGLFSFIISIYLGLTSIFAIKKICILCFVTYFINLSIGLISTDFKNGGFRKSIKDSFIDFISGIKTYPIQFITTLIIIILFLTYTTIEMPFASRKQSIKHYMSMKHNPYAISGNTLGNKNGKIKVDLYTDFACPVCYSYNIMLHKLVKENNNIEIIHHNLPLDKTENPYLNRQMHKGSGLMARFSIAAQNQGKYWNMADLIFKYQPKTLDEGIELGKKIGLDEEKFKFDVNSKETKQRLKKEISLAVEKGVDGTPTIIVKNRMYHGAKAYYEIKRMVLINE